MEIKREREREGERKRERERGEEGAEQFIKDVQFFEARFSPTLNFPLTVVNLIWDSSRISLSDSLQNSFQELHMHREREEQIFS